MEESFRDVQPSAGQEKFYNCKFYGRSVEQYCKKLSEDCFKVVKETHCMRHASSKPVFLSFVVQDYRLVKFFLSVN